MADEATSTTETVVETSGNGATTETQTDAAPVITATGDLGAAGKRAIDAMKAERNQSRDALKAMQTDFEALKAQVAGKEAEHKQQLEAQKVKDEALAAANTRILKAEVRAAAAGKLADPSDALAYIDLSTFDVGENGDVDAAAVTAAIADLISKKPYLAAQGQGFKGSADAGARNESGGATQLTEADVKRLYAEKNYDAIEKARTDGRLKSVLGG